MELREYQREAVEQMCRQRRVILADHPGLGKTLSTLAASLKLAPTSPRQILVFAPGFALGTWVKEIEKWEAGTSFVISGKTPPNKRKKLWEQYFEERPDFLILSYPMVEEVYAWKANWNIIICDEYHKAGLVNRKSKTYQKFARLHSNNLFLLSGTPVRKGPQDLWAPLHLSSPQRFPSFWKFVNEHCITIRDEFGYSIEPRPKDSQAFKKFIAPFVIRRTKAEVLKELPPLQRQPIYLELAGKQKTWYERLAEHDLLEVDDKVIACPNKATTIMRLRQLLTCPALLGIPQRGTALDTLVEMLEDIEEPVVICTPFREALAYIEEALKPQGRPVYKIHGQMKGDAIQVAEAFQRSKSTNKVLAFTIATGMSFDAFSASKAFFVGAEWSAIQNTQAESRLHRMGQTDPVHIYYLLFKDTIDEAIIERLDENTMAEGWSLDVDMMVERLQRR